MTTITDRELLQQYAETGSHDAFAELVARHNNWIYSAALRLVRRCDWAQDVTQAVFLVLAKQAKTLKLATLDGWLFKVTRYCAANLLREENRRKNRERQAATMNNETREPVIDSVWEDIAPVLEQSVGRLRTLDRDAVLLRFYQQKSMSEVGEALGISEDAARKRVAKALDALRSLMSACQVTLPSAGAAITLLSRHATQTAPAELGASCLPGAGSATASRIAHGVNQMIFALKLKLAALAIVAITMIPTGVWMGLHASSPSAVTVQPTVQPNVPVPTRQITLPTTQPDLDLSTPYRTIASMFAAIKAGDHDRLYRCLLTNPGKEPSTLYRALDFDLAASRMMNAATSTFGHAADSITQRDDAFGQVATRIWSDGPSGAKCVMTNDTAQLQAQITPALLDTLPPNARNVASQWSTAPIYFQKHPDGWKLDIDRSFRIEMHTEVDAATPEDEAVMNAGVLQDLAKYCDQITADIHTGRLSTVSQTAKAMGNAQKILKQYGMTRLETKIFPASATAH